METQIWTALEVIDEQGVKKKNLEGIFYELSEHDDDFNGNNVEDSIDEDNPNGCNWDETVEAGFESNCDYLINEVLKDIKDDEVLELDNVYKLIDEFLDSWTYHDSYYDGVAVDFRIENNVLFVAVAVTTD